MSDDTRVVNMRINNKDFLSGTSESLKALDSLNKGIDNAGKGKGINDLGKGVDTVRTKFGALQVAGITALSNITNRAVNAGLKLVKSLTLGPVMDGFHEYEKVLTSTQTIMANTGATANQAGRALDSLNSYSDKTVYNFGQMADNIGKFTAAGVKIDDAVSSIKGLANSAALAGSSNEQLGTAMYQMSQALAQGTIKLMDWNSLANAGMGGKNMRDSLMATARTIGDHGKAMDGAIKKYGSFRESLRSGWLSADVFNKSMKVMAGQTIDTSTSLKDLNKLGLGKTTQEALKAGTTVKFTTKELANLADRGFNKTQISALAAGKTIAYTAEQLQKMGYSKQAAKELSRLSQSAIDSATKIKTFSQLIDVVKESIGSGWAGVFRQLFGNLTEASKMWTKVGDTITGAVSNMFKGVIGVLKAWHDMKDAQTGMNGFQMFWAAIGNIFKSIGNLLHPFIVLLQGLLPASDDAGKGLFSLTQGFYQLSVWLEKITSGTSALDPVLRGLGAVFQFIFGVVGAVVGSYIDLIKLFAPLGGAVLGLLQAFGQLSEKLLGMVGIGDGISGAFQSFVDVRKAILLPFIDTLTMVVEALTALVEGHIGFDQFKRTFVGAFSNLGDSIGNMAAKGQEIANQLIAGLASGLKSGAIQGAITGFVNSILDFFKGLLGIHSPSTVFEGYGRNIVEGLANGLIGAISFVVGAIGGIFDSLKGMDKFDWVNLFSTLFSGAVIVTVFRFVNGLSKIMNNFSGVFKSTSGVLNQVTNNLKTMQNGVRSKIILNIAIAVGVLAASLWVLSKIPADQLKVSLGAVAVMMAMLVGSMVALAKVSGKISLPLVAASLIAMAGALLILSVAVLAFGSMDWKTLAKGFAGIALGLIVMVGAMLALSKAAPSVILGAGALVIAALALTMLSGVILIYDKLDWSTLASGLLKMAVTMGVMALGMAALAAAGPSTILAAAALLILSLALTGMLGAITLFAGVSWGTIISGIAKIAAAIIVIGLAAEVAAPGLLILGVAVGLIGLGMLAAGLGMALFAAGLAAVAIAGVGAGAALAAAFETFLSMLPFMAIQVVAALVAIITAIADAMPRIVKALVKIGSSLLDGIAQLSPKIVETIVGIIEDLLAGLLEIAPQIIDAGIQLIQDFIQGITDNMSGIIDKGTDLVIALITGIGDASERIVPAAGEAILSFLTALDSAITTYEPQIIAMGMKIARDLVLGLVQGIVPQPVLDAFTGFVDRIVTFFKGLLGINSPSTVFSGFGRNIVEGLVNGITGAISAVTSAFGKLVQGGITIVRGLPGKVRSALSGLGGLLSGIFGGAFKSALGFVNTGVHNIGSAIGKIPGLISGIVGKVSSAARSVGKAIIEGIGKGIGALGHFATNVGSALKRAVNGAMGLPKHVGFNVDKGPIHIHTGVTIPAFVKGVTNFSGGAALVGEAGPEVVTMGRGSNVLTNKNLLAFIRQVQSLTKALVRGSTPSTSSSGHISYSVDANFKGDPKANGVAFAANIAAGLINGLKSNQTSVEKNMTAMGVGVTKAFSDILGIQSPSTVFAKLGGYVSAGFIKGLLRSVSSVQAAAKTMALAAVDTVSVTISDAQLGLEKLFAEAEALDSASKNKKLSAAARKKLAKQAADAKKTADAAKASLDKKNEAAARAQQFETADNATKASMKNEDALAAAKSASDKRQAAIKAAKEANLIRSKDKGKAANLDNAAKIALAQAQVYSDKAAKLAKEASDFAAAAKVDEASSGNGPANITSVSAEDVLSAQGMFDRYTKLMADVQAAAAQDAPPSVTYEQNLYSPEAISPSEAYRNGKNLVSIIEKKLVGSKP